MWYVVIAATAAAVAAAAAAFKCKREFCKKVLQKYNVQQFYLYGLCYAQPLGMPPQFLCILTVRSSDWHANCNKITLSHLLDQIFAAAAIATTTIAIQYPYCTNFDETKANWPLILSGLNNLLSLTAYSNCRKGRGKKGPAIPPPPPPYIEISIKLLMYYVSQLKFRYMHIADLVNVVGRQYICST